MPHGTETGGRTTGSSVPSRNIHPELKTILNHIMNRHILLFLPVALLAACSERAATPDAAGADSSKAADSAKSSAASPAPAVPGTTAPARKYDVQSGSYEMKSTALGGITQHYYFDDYGAREAVFTTAKGAKPPREMVDVTVNGEKISYDLMTKFGNRMTAPNGNQVGGGRLLRASEFTDSMKSAFKFNRLPPRTVLEKEATGYEFEFQGVKIKAWTWNQIPMYVETDMGTGRPIVMEATKVDLESPVPAGKFTVPSDIKFADGKSIQLDRK